MPSTNNPKRQKGTAGQVLAEAAPATVHPAWYADGNDPGPNFDFFSTEQDRVGRAHLFELRDVRGYIWA